VKTNNIDETTLTELDRRGYVHCLHCGWVPSQAHGDHHSDEVTWSIFNQRIQQLRAVGDSGVTAVGDQPPPPTNGTA
jgi:hypothetical protein